MTETTKQKLISTIYAATLSPREFNAVAVDLSEQIEGLLSGKPGSEPDDQYAPSPDLGLSHDVIAEMAEHVKNAHAIQARIGHLDEGRERVQFIVDSAPNPALVFDSQEQVVAMNGLARIQFGAAPFVLSDVVRSPGPRARLRKELAELETQGEFASISLPVDPASENNAYMLVKKIGAGWANGAEEEPQETLYLLTMTDFGFDERVTASIRNSFGLTDAEAAIAVALASGPNAEEIAERRSVSLQTIRTQIKSVKHKTRVRDLPHLVRLICGISAGLNAPGSLNQAQFSRLVRGTSASSFICTLSDGRRMEYVVQGAALGAPKSRPVLLFHNMPYGLVLPEAAIAEAARRGLTIIAPFRPAHGRSDPLPRERRPVTGEELLNQVTRDAAELLAHLGIAKVKLVGNVGGSTYAIRFASLFSEKVSDILMVSRAPVWREQWLANVPRRQRLISLLLRHMPSLASVFVWAILSYVNKKDGGDFLRQSVKESAADLKALEDRETLQLMVDGISCGLTQGADGFCRDWELMEIDMCAEARALPHKMHILQGAEDRITRPEFSAAFVEEVPQATLELIESAGNLLFYSHWRRVIERL